MGCKRKDYLGNIITDPCSDTDACLNYEPLPADRTIGLTYTEYPQDIIRQVDANVPNRTGQAVMYDSVRVCLTQGQASFGQSGFVTPSSGANCGRVTRSATCFPTCQNGAKLIYDYFPSQLSFDIQGSDTWFAYLYDTSNNAGIIGTPAFWLENEEQTDNTDPSNPITISNTNCFPCSNFTCTPASTGCSYTVESDIDYTGDPDCPHPTLFGIGTNSNKIVFEYDSLSTTLPDGVLDLSASYDGVTYSDAWNEGEGVGIIYDSTQNTWQAGDEAAGTFNIYELNSGSKQGLKLNVKIEPIIDESGSTVAFTGTRWQIQEIINPGVNYAVNDVFSLTHDHTHPDNTTTTFTLNIKITAVGPIQSQTGSITDVLRRGDTLNGHTITQVVHGPSIDSDYDTSQGLFPYHFAYLDGNGSNFTKDTSYTSNRAHQVTVRAGKGVVDRGFFGGLYEFSEKSVQYTIGTLDRTAPDIYNVLKQPSCTATVTNGRVTNVTIDTDGGGSGWNQLGRPPELSITTPYIKTGIPAEVEGTFSNGVLTAVNIINQGSGYSSTNPPQITVRNIFKTFSSVADNAAYNPEAEQDASLVLDSFPSLGDAFPSYSEEARQRDRELYLSSRTSIEAQTASTQTVATIDIKTDPNNKKIIQKQQQGVHPEDIALHAEEMRPKADYSKLDEIDFGDSTEAQEFKRAVKDQNTREIANHEQNIADLTQSGARYRTRDESFIETVQGPFSELPAASTYTKYFLRQFRPDPRQDTTITVNLSVNVANVGTSHFSCPQPPASTRLGSQFSFLGGPSGPGCQNWSASGSMLMLNDFTSATRTLSKATAAYGNPYVVT